MRITLAYLMAATVAFAAPKNIWEPPFFNGVAAEVEKTLITYDDLRREIAPVAAQVRQQCKSQEEYDAKMSELYDETLKSLIERALLVAEFKERGYKIPAKDVDTEYRRTLKESFGGKTSELVAALQQQGLTLPVYRKRLEENIMVQSLQSKFRHELPDVTPAQIQAYYNDNAARYAREGSVKLSVITFKPITDEPVDVVVQTATEVRAKILAGGDFSKLAAENNQEGTPDWGWLSNSDLAAELSEALESLKTGELTQPVIVEGPKVLLAKVEDRRNEGLRPLPEVSEEIKRILFEERARVAYTKSIELLKKKYFVKINE